MAVSVITTPRKNINGYDSDAASTTQLLYKFNEDTITPGEAYVLQVVVPELSNLTRYYVPQTNGDIEFNIGPSIESALFAAGLIGIQYTLDYSSVRNGVETAEGSTIAIFGVISDRQILTTNGANLYEYILKTLALNQGKPLTHFSETKKWVGWDKLLYFLNMDYATIDVVEFESDINKVFIPPSVVTNTTPTPPLVISHLLMEPVDAAAEFNRVVVQSSASDVSTNYYVKIEPECKQPVMIEWLNSLGGYDTWLFSYEQAITNVNEEGRKWQRPIAEDIADVRTTKGRYAPKTIQYMTLKTAFLTMNEVQTLHEIKGSEQVRLWLNKDGSEYVGVTVNTGYTTDYTTGKSNYEFSLNVELPDNFDFFKAKLY